jgi:hypothetical protein
MAYATTDDLAAQLRQRVTPANEAWYQACLDAAALEIDHWLDVPVVDPPLTWTDTGDLALLQTVNVGRALEWAKSNDAAFGAIGFADSGVLRAPNDSFDRHAMTLVPLKTQFGIA